MKSWVTIAAGVCALLSSTSARASISMLGGPQVGTHAGNLVVNGSFETGAPAAGTSVYWATGTTSAPFAVPTGWTSSGTADNYALWGSDQAIAPCTIDGSA